METTRWTNPSQPQPLQSAVILLYLSAAIDVVLSGGAGLTVPIAIGRVAAGWGCANEKKWGYQLAVTMAVLPFVLLFAFVPLGDIADDLIRYFIRFAFDIVLIVLLLNEQARSYQRIWFR